MKYPIACLAFSFAAFTGNPATAQEAGTPVDRASVGPEGKMILQAVSVAYESLEGVLPPGKILRLMVIAKQRAIATACDQFEMDDARYTAAMKIAIEDVVRQGEPEKNNQQLDKVMFAFATVLGAELAVSAYNPDQYCAFGDELREEFKEQPDSNLIIFKDRI